MEKELIIRNPKSQYDSYELLVWQDGGGWYWQHTSDYAPTACNVHGPYVSRHAALCGEARS